MNIYLCSLQGKDPSRLFIIAKLSGERASKAFTKQTNTERVQQIKIPGPGGIQYNVKLLDRRLWVGHPIALNLGFLPCKIRSDPSLSTAVGTP